MGMKGIEDGDAKVDDFDVSFGDGNTAGMSAIPQR